MPYNCTIPYLNPPYLTGIKEIPPGTPICEPIVLAKNYYERIEMMNSGMYGYTSNDVSFILLLLIVVVRAECGGKCSSHYPTFDDSPLSSQKTLAMVLLTLSLIQVELSQIL
jgi:hypothetical protein